MFSLILLTFIIAPSLEVDLTSKIKILNGNEYYARLLQETFYEIEERCFCNLKLTDFNQTLNENLYNWHVVGHAYYTNGFVVSLERISLTGQQTSAHYSNSGVTTASFVAIINMFNVKIGYDITAVLDKEGTHRFTGIYNHNLLQLTLTLTKNLASGEFTAESSRLSVSGGSGVRMVYMPESSISEVLSRRGLFRQFFSDKTPKFLNWW